MMSQVNFCISFLPSFLSSMEFIHKANPHFCCVKGCGHAAIRPLPKGYRGEALGFCKQKSNTLCNAHHRAVLDAMKVILLESFY